MSQTLHISSTCPPEVQHAMYNSTSLVQRPTCLAIQSSDFSFLHTWMGIKRTSDTEKRQIRAKAENPYTSTLFRSVEMVEIMAFSNLLGDEKVRTLFEFDLCRKMADKYLIAMVFIYFKRADFMIAEYNPANFFLALYLAHDMEEDEDTWKEDVLPLALGLKWRTHKLAFLIQRDRLWKRIGYRGIVSRRSCDAVFAAVHPEHSVWQRNRPVHHSYALRIHHRNQNELEPTGDYPFIRFCPDCFSRKM